MIAGDDPTPWNLLHDGTIVRLERDLADEVTVWIDAPYLRAKFPDGGTLFRFRLAGCTELVYWPFDEPPIEELAAIASSEPSLGEARVDRGDIKVVGNAGSLFVHYASLALELDTGTAIAIDELRRVVRAYWEDWRVQAAPVVTHPAIQAVLEGQPLREAVPRLLAAWRDERTSELAKALVIVDERTRGAPPTRLAHPDTFDAWCTTWTSDPGAALAELVRRAQACWAEVMASHDARRYDELAPERDALWRGFARCAEVLRAAAPDPRIGLAVEGTLESPSDNWFRIDQVAHVLGSYAKPHDEPSFADHALALLDFHADAGTATRVDDKADRLLHEAACNEAEMSQRLRALAAKLRTRYPQDRTLLEEIASALRSLD